MMRAVTYRCPTCNDVLDATEDEELAEQYHAEAIAAILREWVAAKERGDYAAFDRFLSREFAREHRFAHFGVEGYNASANTRPAT